MPNSRILGWGWVANDERLILLPTRTAEESTTGFTDASIHRLHPGLRWEVGGGGMGSRWVRTGSNVFLSKQVRFRYGYEERTLGPIGKRAREGLPCLRMFLELAQQREDAAGGLQA